MLKMKFWFEGNQLQPDCNIHGGCKIGSSACHACPHCVRVNSKDQEVLCLGDGSEYKEVKLEEYSRKLWERMEMLGITSEDVMNPNYTGQNMSFGEALQALEAGKCVARKGWITTCFVVKQIDSDIPAEVVPKMQSLPQHAKNLLNAFGVGSISYRSQCLLVEQAGDGNGATNYVPDWVDMFAKDWFVLGGE